MAHIVTIHKNINLKIINPSKVSDLTTLKVIETLILVQIDGYDNWGGWTIHAVKIGFSATSKGPNYLPIGPSDSVKLKLVFEDDRDTYMTSRNGWMAFIYWERL